MGENKQMSNKNNHSQRDTEENNSSTKIISGNYVLVPQEWLDQISKTINDLRQEVKNISIAGFYNKDILDMEEAAKYTGLSTGYLYKLVSRREISCYKAQVGHKNYFKKEDLNHWLLAKRCLTMKEIEEQAAAYTLKNPVMGKKRRQ